MVERISAIGEELTVPGRYAVDAIPILERLPSWFPGAGFKSYATMVRPEVGEAVKNKPWRDFMANREVRLTALLLQRTYLYELKNSATTDTAQ